MSTRVDGNRFRLSRDTLANNPRVIISLSLRSDWVYMSSSQPSDEQMHEGQQWLSQLLQTMGIPAEVTVTEDPVVGMVLAIDAGSLTPEQRQAFLEAREEGSPIMLDALQFLTNTLLNLHHDKAEQRTYQLDIDGYRAQRQQQLEGQAQTAAAEVRQTGQPVELLHLSAAERRQVHSYLSEPEFTDLKTESQGIEPDRRLVVALVDPA